jgi:tetratricopeptide (TPR) repeat protein
MNKLAVFVRTITIIAGAAAIYRFCVLPVRCAHALQAIENSTNALDSMPGWRAASFARFNLRVLGSFDRSCWTEINYHLLLAANADILGRKQEVLQHFGDALEVDDWPMVYYHRGLILLQLGRLDDAVRDLAIAVDFDPTLIGTLDGELRARVAQAVALTDEARRRHMRLGK